MEQCNTFDTSGIIAAWLLNTDKSRFFSLTGERIL